MPIKTKYGNALQNSSTKKHHTLKTDQYGALNTIPPSIVLVSATISTKQLRVDGGSDTLSKKAIGVY